MDVLEKVEGTAKIIGITPSTVKKYYLLFEQEGYKFKRSQEGHVLFSDYDIDLLKELIVLKNQSGMTVQKAVKEIVKDEVVTGITDITDTTGDITVMAKQVTTVISELKQLVKEQNEFMKQQQKLLDQSNEQEKARLGRHDKLLMESIRESQESKKMFREIQEQISQIAATKEEKKKGFFARLFGK